MPCCWAFPSPARDACDRHGRNGHSRIAAVSRRVQDSCRMLAGRSPWCIASMKSLSPGPQNTVSSWGCTLKDKRRSRELHFVSDEGRGSTSERILTNPAAHMASQGGTVDWFCFWPKGEEDPDPAMAEQYARWRTRRKLQRQNSSERGLSNGEPSVRWGTVARTSIASGRTDQEL